MAIVLMCGFSADLNPLDGILSNQFMYEYDVIRCVEVMLGRDSGIDAQWDDPDAYDGQYPPDWDARRRAVYQRDNYTCQQCGHRSGPHAGSNGVVLHAHHHVSLSQGGWNHLRNLVTVCQNCHDQIHGHLTGHGYRGRSYNGARVIRGLVSIFRRAVRRLL